MSPAPMTPAWHAEQTPDVPAIVMGASGEVVTDAQLPRDDSGKLYKRLLRERYWAGHASRVS